MQFKHVNVLVIGEESRLRSASLPEFISRLQSNGGRVRFAKPVFAGTDATAEFNSALFYHYGLPSTAGELGCALAHASAYSQISALGLDFCWIFEDDAEVEPVLLAEAMLSWQASARLSARPSAISLYSPDLRAASVRSRQESGRAILSQLWGGAFPKSTMAYGINRSAAELAARTELIGSRLPAGKADFPIWGSAVSWSVASHHGLVWENPSEERSIVGQRPTSTALQIRFGQFGLLMNRVKGIGLGAPKVKISLRAKLAWELAEFFFALVDRVSPLLGSSKKSRRTG